MGLRMKHFNIKRVHWKIWFLGRVHKKPIYRGESPKKVEPVKFAGLREGWRKGGDGVDTPCTLCHERKKNDVYR